MTHEERKPLWLYPNLLSLDAPLVAVSWLYVFAHTWRLYLPWEVYLALALGVWVIYSSDRLLDVAMRQGSDFPMEARHRFHQAHRKYFTLGIILAILCAAVLVTTRMPVAIFKYLVIGGIMIGGFFGLSMISTQQSHEIAHTKNTIAGATFAFGTTILAHLYRNEVDLFEMLASREFLCFAVLCVLNISAIDIWEHSARIQDEEVKAGNEMALTIPLVLLGIAALCFAVFDGNDPLAAGSHSTRPFFYAILTGAASLYGLNRVRADYSADAVRVLADVALLVPILVFAAASGI